MYCELKSTYNIRIYKGIGIEEGTTMDSNSAASRDEEKFKQIAATLISLFALLSTLGLVKTSDAGQEFFKKHTIVMNALVLSIVVFFLVLLLLVMLQSHLTSFSATLLILVMGTLVSVLALSLISLTTAIITFALWVITFIMVAIFNCQHLYKPIPSTVLDRIKKFIERSNPQFGAPKKCSEMDWELQATEPV